MSRRVRVWYRKAVGAVRVRLWCGAVRPGCQGNAVKARRGMSGFVASRNVVAAQGSRGAFGFGEAMRGNASQGSQGSQGWVRRVLFWRVPAAQVEAVKVRNGGLRMVMSGYRKAVAEWSGWHVPSGPGPVLQGSREKSGMARLGSASHGSARQSWIGKEGVSGQRSARQSGSGEARPVRVCPGNAAQRSQG
jgi:hypothetical protein